MSPLLWNPKLLYRRAPPDRLTESSACYVVLKTSLKVRRRWIVTQISGSWLPAIRTTLKYLFTISKEAISQIIPEAQTFR